MASLKGAIAVFIAAYHYWAWGIGQPADWAVNLAQFGVVLFFTMSGYGLAQGYQVPVNWRRFWRRRAQRILPWFWVATIATVLLAGWPSLRSLVLNLILLWPIVDLRGYIATGAWAIGCEALFYAWFWLWGLGGFSQWTGWAIVAASVAIGWAMLSPDYTLAVQWAAWINPTVQASAFFAGALLVPRLSASWVWPLSWLALCLLVPTPWAISWLRPLLIVAGCGLVAALVKWRSPADILGKYSYQIYLLHPIVWNLLIL
ncbi:hypothetical protein H6F75_00510 [Nodosilinea sp. FACHB-131]|uniref:acyltransferase family protein n=1 Tax=Cyanophyceae TaxID=3028117 RepID=UPI00168A35F5|nr:acyltransferase family protein [Nodosilinea sp. FACHB-131]MBD1871952.1 hypothetical protein [Nodosilinea sp. FACHB-131]